MTMTDDDIKAALLGFVKNDDVSLFELPNYPGFQNMTYETARLVCNSVNEMQSAGLIRVAVTSCVDENGSHDCFDAVLTTVTPDIRQIVTSREFDEYVAVLNDLLYTKGKLRECTADFDPAISRDDLLEACDEYEQEN